MPMRSLREALSGDMGGVVICPDVQCNRMELACIVFLCILICLTTVIVIVYFNYFGYDVLLLYVVYQNTCY